MKQHITLKQWDEITNEQKNKLWRRGFTKDWKMDIGRMVEFLGEDLISMCFDGKKSRDLRWNVFFMEEGDKKGFIETELCDALWEAVKHKLK